MTDYTLELNHLTLHRTDKENKYEIRGEVKHQHDNILWKNCTIYLSDDVFKKLKQLQIVKQNGLEFSSGTYTLCLIESDKHNNLMKWNISSNKILTHGGYQSNSSDCVSLDYVILNLANGQEYCIDKRDYDNLDNFKKALDYCYQFLFEAKILSEEYYSNIDVDVKKSKDFVKKSLFNQGFRTLSLLKLTLAYDSNSVIGIPFLLRKIDQNHAEWNITEPMLKPIINDYEKILNLIEKLNTVRDKSICHIDSDSFLAIEIKVAHEKFNEFDKYRISRVDKVLDSINKDEIEYLVKIGNNICYKISKLINLSLPDYQGLRI